MPTIGVYDAKTHLTKLLERVRRGERFVITRHGKPVAQLVPPEVEEETDLEEAIQQMQEWQRKEGPTLGPDLTIRQLIEEGRR